MKTIKVSCDWETQKSTIKISRQNRKTGAYESNSYVIDRYSPREKQLMAIMGTAYYTKFHGSGQSWGIPSEPGIEYYIRENDDVFAL